MKKILAMLLAVVLTLSLVACVSSPSGEIKEPANVATGGDTQPSESKEADPSEEATEPSENVPAPQDATIEETVLVDEAGVKITAKGLSDGSFFGPELKLLIENNSGKDLTFQCRNASVNGYMVETMMSVDVVDGKKANDTLTFTSSALEACGIKTIADMEFSFHIFTSEDWDTYLDTPQIQLKTSAAETYEYTYDDSGEVAYDADGIKIVVKGLSEDDSIFGPGIVVYIENNSEQNFTVQTRDVSVNGFMIDAMFSSDVMVGKRTIDAITFFSSDLEENEIAAIETVELSFHIFDADSWSTITDTDLITITF